MTPAERIAHLEAIMRQVLAKSKSVVRYRPAPTRSAAAALWEIGIMCELALEDEK